MKKSLAVMAAATVTGLFASTAFALETEGAVYGNLRMSLGYFDSDNSDGRVNLDNNNSHLGLRASVKEGAIAGFAQYERLIDTDSATGNAEVSRAVFGGVNTVYGNLIVGRAPTAYKQVGQKLDPFYNTSAAGVTGSVDAPAGGAKPINGASYGQSALNNDTVGSGFINNTLAYTSPAYYGVTGNVAVFLDDGSTNQNQDYAVGAEYNMDAITAGIQYLNIKSGTETGSVQNFNNIGLGFGAAQPMANGEVQAARAYGAYAAQTWGAGVSYEHLSLGNNQNSRNYIFVSGRYTLSEKIGLAASIGNTDGTPFEGYGVTVGAFYDIIKNLSAYTALRHVDRKDSNVGANAGKTNTLAIGLSYSFDIGYKSAN